MAYFDINKYDETPMKVSQKQSLAKVAAEALVQVSGSPADTDTPNIRTSNLAAQLQVKTSSAVKMFATDQKFAFLLRLANDPDSPLEGSEYMLLKGTSLTCLQVLADTKSATLKQALLENNGITDFSKSFKLKFRLTTTDMAGSNVVADKLMVDLRGPDWLHLHNFCNVHVIARCHSRGLFCFEDDISGLINCSLALSTGSSMEQFRSCLASVIAEKLQVVPGFPSPECEQHRDFMLSLFGSTGSKWELKKYLLERLPNGDWRRRDLIQVFIPPGVTYDEAAVKKQIVSVLLLVLGGKLFRTYPRHRWTGADVCVSTRLASVKQFMASSVKPSSG